MENKHLLTAEQFKELARPTSRHVDENDITAFIEECERVFIIPAVGYATYKLIFDVAFMSAFDVTFDVTFNKVNGTTFDKDILLDGGEWDKKHVRGGCGRGDDTELFYCVGLRKTLAYFVYAKMLRSGGAMLARTGFVKHDESYATHIIDKENRNQYNDVMSIAEQYLGSCISYMKYHKLIRENKKVRGNRARIKAIGD